MNFINTISAAEALRANKAAAKDFWNIIREIGTLNDIRNSGSFLRGSSRSAESEAIREMEREENQRNGRTITGDAVTDCELHISTRFVGLDARYHHAFKTREFIDKTNAEQAEALICELLQFAAKNIETFV